MDSALLGGELAEIISDAIGDLLFFDATLTRDIPATTSVNSFDPDPPTQQTFACKALDLSFSSGFIKDGLVSASDVKVMILANTLATTPANLDRITLRGMTLSIVPEGTFGISAVEADSARATWTCRCSR